MKNGNGKKDDFIAPARRAFCRVARQLRAENARLGLHETRAARSIRWRLLPNTAQMA
jgi:hypothetical protein